MIDGGWGEVWRGLTRIGDGVTGLGIARLLLNCTSTDATSILFTFHCENGEEEPIYICFLFVSVSISVRISHTDTSGCSEDVYTTSTANTS